MTTVTEPIFVDAKFIAKRDYQFRINVQTVGLQEPIVSFYKTFITELMNRFLKYKDAKIFFYVTDLFEPDIIVKCKAGSNACHVDEKGSVLHYYVDCARKDCILEMIYSTYMKNNVTVNPNPMTIPDYDVKNYTKRHMKVVSSMPNVNNKDIPCDPLSRNSIIPEVAFASNESDKNLSEEVASASNESDKNLSEEPKDIGKVKEYADFLAIKTFPSPLVELNNVGGLFLFGTVGKESVGKESGVGREKPSPHIERIRFDGVSTHDRKRIEYTSRGDSEDIGCVGDAGCVIS